MPPHKSQGGIGGGLKLSSIIYSDTKKTYTRKVDIHKQQNQAFYKSLAKALIQPYQQSCGFLGSCSIDTLD